MSDRINNLNLSLDEIRSIILETLKNESRTSYHSICANVAELAVKKGIVTDPRGGQIVFGGKYDLSVSDREKVREIIWNLVIERILTIGMDDQNPSWPWLKLTAYGSQVVTSALPVPHDPHGYLSRIRSEIPNIDSIIINYLEESLLTYNINALLSSTVSLGCASEKALLLLIESYQYAIQDTGRREKFIEKTNGKMIKRQFDEFNKSITSILGNIPSDISDGLNNVLLGIFEMIRNNRNDAGHPTGRKIPKEQVFASIQVFMPYCKKVYQLIEYFNNNPIN
jgi:hypothetical protein